MPEPISSSSTPVASSIGSDPTLDEAGQVCQSGAPNRSQPEPALSTPPAVDKLISAVPPPASELPPASLTATPSLAQNNAQRTTEQNRIAPYAGAGITGDFRDSAYAGVAALKGHDVKTGLDVEVFSASAQVGGQNEVQVGLARLGLSGKHGSITTEFFTARANGGAHNDDGSTGGNSGALATVAGIEGTLLTDSSSFTLGFVAGGGAALSIGARDVDGDDIPEKCFKASIGIVTLGICTKD
jgi:hypothetical protein